MMNMDELFKKPAFDSLDPERKAMYKNLGDRLEGKGNMESLAIISDFMNKLPQEKQPTIKEQDAMLDAFLESMPEKERTRLKIVINMMRNKH